MAQTLEGQERDSSKIFIFISDINLQLWLSSFLSSNEFEERKERLTVVLRTLKKGKVWANLTKAEENKDPL